jgi:hypothetical protein
MRILKQDGQKWIAEVKSRLPSIDTFIEKLVELGLVLKKRDDSNKMFIFMYFMYIQTQHAPRKLYKLHTIPARR